jgi:hypothetical protein
MGNQLSWGDISVNQFQDIYRLSSDTSLDEMGRIEAIIGVMFDLTQREVEELSMAKFNDLAKQVAFLTSNEIPGKPVNTIKVGRDKFSITYDPTQLKHRQYVEILHFGDKPIEHMHLIMASVVQPVTWYGRRRKNRAEDHEKIAGILQQSRVIDTYHSCVFFCKLYVSLIRNIRASLVMDMMNQRKEITRVEALRLVNSSIDVMDGFIAHERLRGTKV